MGLYDEFSADGGQSLAQLMELGFGQNYPKMGYRHVILVHVVAVLLWLEGIPHIADQQLMVEHSIPGVSVALLDLLTSHRLRVELVGYCEGVRGDGHREAGSRLH